MGGGIEQREGGRVGGRAGGGREGGREGGSQEKKRIRSSLTTCPLPCFHSSLAVRIPVSSLVTLQTLQVCWFFMCFMNTQNPLYRTKSPPPTLEVGGGV